MKEAAPEQPELTKEQIDKLYNHSIYKAEKKEQEPLPFEIAQKIHTTVTIKYRGVLYSWTMTDRQAWGTSEEATSYLIS